MANNSPEPRYLFEIEREFCENAQCLLHVRPNSPGAEGQGNWARIKLATGETITVGRSLQNGRYVCGICDTKLAPS